MQKIAKFFLKILFDVGKLFGTGIHEFFVKNIFNINFLL